MNGLDAIIESILADAREQADDILVSAAAEAEAIRRQAADDAEKLLRSMAAAAETEAGVLLSRAESSAAMAARRVVLDARRRAVVDVVDRAVASLAGLPAAEKVRLYADFLRSARGGETVIFNKDDLASGVGAKSVEDALQSRAASGLPPIGLSVSDEPGAFLGGLVMRRGLIEDNLTFEMLTRQSRENLETYAATLLEK